MAPEVNLARRVIQKYELEPPVDIISLIQLYAELVFADIPFEGADGVSLNLKVPGKTTRVIVNENNPPLRQRFTMAHELGHVLIPWHTGTIIDHVDPALIDAAGHYWSMEAEANTFAAELLMPHGWIEDLLSHTPNLAKAHKAITISCETSALAAAIRLAQILPRNVMYASERGGVVEFSGRTDGTLANPLIWGEDFPESPFDYSEKHFTATLNDRQLHWWRLPDKIDIEVDDDRSWREILDGILRDIGIPTDEAVKIKSSINGVVAYANSACKRTKRYGVDSIVSACMQRFRDRPQFEQFVEHIDFKAFVLKKAEDLANRNH